jgi:hypothetical protein
MSVYQEQEQPTKGLIQRIEGEIGDELNTIKNKIIGIGERFLDDKIQQIKNIILNNPTVMLALDKVLNSDIPLNEMFEKIQKIIEEKSPKLFQSIFSSMSDAADVIPGVAIVRLLNDGSRATHQILEIVKETVQASRELIDKVNDEVSQTANLAKGSIGNVGDMVSSHVTSKIDNMSQRASDKIDSHVNSLIPSVPSVPSVPTVSIHGPKVGGSKKDNLKKRENIINQTKKIKHRTLNAIEDFQNTNIIRGRDIVDSIFIAKERAKQRNLTKRKRRGNTRRKRR